MKDVIITNNSTVGTGETAVCNLKILKTPEEGEKKRIIMILFFKSEIIPLLVGNMDKILDVS